LIGVGDEGHNIQKLTTSNWEGEGMGVRSQIHVARFCFLLAKGSVRLVHWDQAAERIFVSVVRMVSRIIVPPNHELPHFGSNPVTANDYHPMEMMSK
jgi:hypothetical protein